MMFPAKPIPGQTPLDDLSGLRVSSIRTMADLNAAEAENIRRATVKYLAGVPTRRSAPFDVRWMRALHAQMFGDVWTWAGRLRAHETNVGSVPRSIEIDLNNLVLDLFAWEQSSMRLLEQAVRLHHVAVRIHPFANGNGRWSRMLGNIWLKQHGSKPIAWPETVIGTASTIRDEYLAAVRIADGGDVGPLMAIHERYADVR